MTFLIPPRDMPLDAMKVTDPVTGATYMRPRQHKKKDNPDAYLQGYPKPKTCGTPFCKKAGLPHDECKTRDPFDSYYAYPVYNVSPAVPHGGGNAHDPFDPYHRLPAWSGPYHASPFVPPRPADSPSTSTHFSPFIPPRPSPTEAPDSSAEENAFQRWLQSFPHWRIPRECPPDWRYEPHPERRYTPYRSGNDLPQQEPAYPVYYTPWRYPQYLPAASPWPNVAVLPNRVPDRVEWDNVQGGKLQWTPHPWTAHPLPHPDVPAQAFWDYPIHPNGLRRWVGPGGWSPHYGMDANRVNMVTGGHPPPGTMPYWTPVQWVAPLYPPPQGIILSPWLAANPRNSYVPHILWDVAVEPPYAVRRLTSRGNIVDFASTDFFKEPATTPPVKALQVNLPNTRNSWGPVVIDKDSPIQVGDVFNAVWKYLHKRITPDDWRAFRSSFPERVRKVTWAMYRRCWTSGTLFDYEWRQGLKRVDFLENQTVYWGTYLTYGADGTWSLAIAFVPRTRAAN